MQCEQRERERDRQKISNYHCGFLYFRAILNIMLLAKSE